MSQTDHPNDRYCPSSLFVEANPFISLHKAFFQLSFSVPVWSGPCARKCLLLIKWSVDKLENLVKNNNEKSQQSSQSVKDALQGKQKVNTGHITSILLPQWWEFTSRSFVLPLYTSHNRLAVIKCYPILSILTKSLSFIKGASCRIVNCQKYFKESKK